MQIGKNKKDSNKKRDSFNNSKHYYFSRVEKSNIKVLCSCNICCNT